MIVKTTKEINGKVYDYTYSDLGMKILRDGVEYDEALDPAGSNRIYTESGTPISEDTDMWEQINETNAGTVVDPIPYSGNMALESGKYYVQDYVIYLCTRDTVNPVHNALDDLVGVYVDTV